MINYFSATSKNSHISLLLDSCMTTHKVTEWTPSKQQSRACTYVQANALSFMNLLVLSPHCLPFPSASRLRRLACLERPHLMQNKHRTKTAELDHIHYPLRGRGEQNPGGGGEIHLKILSQLSPAPQPFHLPCDS